MSASFYRRFFIGLLLLNFVSATFAEAPFAFETTPGKLPKTVVPKNYSLRIQPDFTNLTTHGTLTTEIQVLKSVKKITLNALDLEITRATLLTSASKSGRESSLEVRPDTNAQTVTLLLPNQLKPGKYQLALEFNGHLREQAQGLFYVKYAAPSGKKMMLATQMEPTDARRMFPCWDEPVFRASMDLTVVLPAKHKAVSNMPVERESVLPNGLKETRFARTPPMASYLVVLVAGELDEIKDEVDGLQIRVITTEGKQEQGRYALETTKKLLPYYNRYFGIKYPLPKLDQIAIPGGFSGAMENWGGITYNESALLFDLKSSSQQTRRDIFVTVAHEMAHQWFGNLVTTAWWDNLWLNEGFATWMENKATDHFNPDWQMWLSASLDKTSVMSDDARSTTHPIQEPVESESDANDAFDTITYQKGGAFLRVFEDYLGPEEFRRGIHRYLSRHRYSSATTADLWQALEDVSGKPVKAVASGWTEQPGLPVLKIKSECENGHQILSLDQERFVVQNPKAESLEWKIPVALLNVSSNQSITHLLLEGKASSITFDHCDNLFKVNAGDVGYYRVSYEPALFQKLRAHLNSFSTADRLNLLNDSWAMVEAARSPITNYFSLVESLRDDSTLAIWGQIFSVLYLFDNLEQGQPNRKPFQAYARTLLRPQLQRLGWTPKAGEPVNDPVLRAKIINALGHFGDQSVIAESKKRFEDFLHRPESLTPDLRSAVLSIAGRYSDKTLYDQLHLLAQHATGTEDRQRYYHAMSCALDPDLARATLAISLTDETVPQEATALVAQVAENGEQPELALNFAKTHLKELLAKVDSFERNNYLPSIFNSFSDEARVTELETYVKTNISPDAAVKAHEGAEQIRFKAILKQRELPVVDQWVAAQLAGADQKSLAE